MGMDNTIAGLKERLENIIDSVASNGFYRRKYGIEELDLESSKKYILDNFEELPYLTRDELPELHRVAMSDAVGSRILFTGGTSGFPGLLEVTPEELHKCNTALKRPLEICGIKEGSTILSTCSMTRSGYGLHIDDVAMDLKCTLFQCNDAQSYNFRMIEEFSKKRKIDVIMGTPMGVLGLTHDGVLMEHLRGVKVVFICGSPMDAKIEKALRDGFRCHVIDYIGTTEIGGIGYRFSASEPFTYIRENVIIEVDAATGRAVLTNLSYRHMPIVRLMTDDLAELTGDDKFLFKGRAKATFFIGGTKISMDVFHKICRMIGSSETFQLTMRKNGTVTELILNIVDEKMEYDMEAVRKCILDENVALYEKMEKNIVVFGIEFIGSEDLIGADFRGKFKRLVEL